MLRTASATLDSCDTSTFSRCSLMISSGLCCPVISSIYRESKTMPVTDHFEGKDQSQVHRLRQMNAEHATSQRIQGCLMCGISVVSCGGSMPSFG